MSDPQSPDPQIIVIGGGPAGLMAAEAACAAGVRVALFEAKGSVGRKFLIAGKGGLNLTHGEEKSRFVTRYGARQREVSTWLEAFDADALRQWARDLGVETFVGTSGRVFPLDQKAAPLLRAWVRRLREQGVVFHTRHQWLGWDASGALRFKSPDGECLHSAPAVVLALGGGSWPHLGSDGAWIPHLQAQGVAVAPLQPANCGFEVNWSAHFAERYAGQPIKPVILQLTNGSAKGICQQGELMVTAQGLEGSLIYALSSVLRQALEQDGAAEITLDLQPGRTVARLQTDLARPRNGRSLSEHLRRAAGLEGVKLGLLREVLSTDQMQEPVALAQAIKSLPLRLVATRPMAEAISTAGGVMFEACTSGLMINALPGVFCAGEMLDWEAPTGGYLLTACMASGVVAGRAAAHWVLEVGA